MAATVIEMDPMYITADPPKIPQIVRVPESNLPWIIAGGLTLAGLIVVAVSSRRKRRRRR